MHREIIGVVVDYNAVSEYMADISGTRVDALHLEEVDAYGDIFDWALEHAPECIHLQRPRPLLPPSLQLLS